MTYRYLSRPYDENPFNGGDITSYIVKLDLPSEELEDDHRDVLVYLPAEYYLEPERRFPVLYMQDGHNIFSGDPLAPYGTWDVDQTIEELVDNGEIDPLIIVGIQARDRFPEYTNCRIKGEQYTPKLDLYTNYLINTVKPTIDNHFRTLPDAENSALAGSSLGGLSAFRICWQHPYIFGKCAALSPSTWVGSKENWETSLRDESLEKLVLKTPREMVPQLKIYLDNGSVGCDGDNYSGDAWCYTDHLRNALISKGYAVRYEYLQEGAEAVENLPPESNPDDIHELFWAENLPDGYNSWYDFLRPDLDLCHLVGRYQAHCEGSWRARFASALRFLYL